MKTYTILTQQVHGSYYQGGLEIAEKGDKRSVWCNRVSFTKEAAIIEANEMKEEVIKDEKI